MRRREFITLIGGAAVASPLVARAQQPAMPLVGFMSARSPGDSAHLVAAFRRGMGEGGFVEGQNVAVEYRWANGEYDRLPALAADLVNRRVAVLVAIGGDVSALAAKRATSTIPIVFGSGSDPVAIGMVASINRPGGNVTGVNVLTNQMEPKRLGLLHELVPGVPLIGVLMNQNFPPAARQLLDLEEASRTIGQRLFVAKASNDTELDAAFTALAQQQVRALLVAADPYFDTRRERIVAFAAQHRLPAMYQFREYAAAGGLVSYGVSLSEAYRLEGAYTAKILKGEKPSDLPVQLLVKTELVINLKAAKALGFEFPATFSARADEVIE
jgi:putative tryptophan/tyrosine transport system substrate-binding protein